MVNYTSSTLLSGSKDDDYIYNGYGASNVTISAGKGNDSIYNNGSSVTIKAGAGNDSISNYGDYVTIGGGAGNDLISFSSYAENNVIKYSAGDGNDTIYGFNSTSILQLGTDNYSTQASGNDLLVKVGKGSIRLKNAYATTDNICIASGSKSISLSKTVKLSSADTIQVARNYFSVVGSSGNDSINNSGAYVTINAGAGAGNDYISNSYYNSSNVTVNGGAGDDIVYLSSYNPGDSVIQYVSGDGNDVIQNFNTKSTLSIAGGSHSTATSGNDIIVTVGKGQITLQNAATLSSVNIVNSTPVTVGNSASSAVTIDSEFKSMNASSRTKAIQITGNSYDNLIRGGSGADKLYGQAGDDTLRGGKDNDSLWGGNGADKFIYTSGDGQDIIYGFDNDDMLLITGAFSASYSKSKKEVYFKVGSTDKAVTLKDFTATSFSVNGIDYKVSGSKLVEK